MGVRKSERRSLTREDWTTAALQSISQGGIDAVAIETIATKVGATKGSFYWHFKNRDELIDAALVEWERLGTDVVIAMLDGQPTPEDRLATLFAMTAAIPADLLGVEIALLARPGHPRVLATMRRVAERRITYMAEQFEAMGWSSRDALDRALLIYYLFVGRLQTRHISPPGIDETVPQRFADLLSKIVVAAPMPRAGGRRRPAPSRRPVS